MSDRLLKESDVMRIAFQLPYMVNSAFFDVVKALPSADRPKHYCAECKFEPIDKRCMPCSSCTNNPKNRDAFVSCEVEKKGADDGADNI